MSALAQRTRQERLWIVGGALAALVVTLVGWFFFISPQRSDTDDVNGQAQSVRAANVDWQGRISSLQAESKNMNTVQRTLRAAQAALPSTSGVPDFLRSLQSLGASTGTDVVSLSVGQPTDVSTVTGAAPATSGASASPSPSATPTTPAGSTAPGTGVYGLTISAQVNGATDRLNDFLKKLQTVQPRAVLITHITEGSAVTSDATSLQLTMQAFVAPTSPAEQTQLSQQAGK